MDRENYTITKGSTLTALATPLGESQGMDVPLRMFMQMDPPDHTAFRGILSPHFTPRKFKQVEPIVREIVSHYLEPLV